MFRITYMFEVPADIVEYIRNHKEDWSELFLFKLFE